MRNALAEVLSSFGRSPSGTVFRPRYGRSRRTASRLARLFDHLKALERKGMLERRILPQSERRGLLVIPGGVCVGGRARRGGARHIAAGAPILAVEQGG